MSGKAKFWTVIVVLWFGFMFAWNLYKQRQEEAKVDTFRNTVLARLDAAEKSSATPAQKSKQIIDAAFMDWGALDIVNERYPDHPIRQRAIEHVALGYQAIDPVGSLPFERLADIDCAGRVNRVTKKSGGYTRDDVIAGWAVARRDLETWTPNVANAREVSSACEHRFALILKRIEPKETTTVKDVGAVAGKVVGEVGSWWDSATKPLSDAVDEFKAGYSSGKK
ncbi:MULTISPECIES: hypothetical protein [unclassified Neorhizobium]|uniref:hypothetical protein n=1 Tax=unclassified Neorhizobium TaxID=2629175 RepID=UPI001FF17625|nr:MULTISPECIES: hypothetical protein [unclassified Neorhizobium]MCJ9674324.1 hypothetical protein [Neorhizobium sp. SHOUNA12B]MCJ9745439.1 hypothetical protein [Neorhizobium sp. SHOUNA12A]